MIGVQSTAPAFCAICCADIHGRPIRQVIGNALVDLCSDCGGNAIDVSRINPGDRHRAMRQTSRTRRASLIDAGKCLNGAHHGKATHGRRCEWCDAVHKHGLEAVLADPNAPTRPEQRRGRRSA